jgi:hypothetical protein
MSCVYMKYECHVTALVCTRVQVPNWYWLLIVCVLDVCVCVHQWSPARVYRVYTSVQQYMYYVVR